MLLDGHVPLRSKRHTEWNSASWPLGPGHLDIVTESFNLLNHRNITLLNTASGSGIQPQANFGLPIATSTARRIQFSLDYEF